MRLGGAKPPAEDRSGVSLVLGAWFVFLLLGCNGKTPYVEPIPSQPWAVSFNGVKLISPYILQGGAEDTFAQVKYEVGPDRRLLLRFKELSEHIYHIDTYQKSVYLRLNFESETMRDVAQRSALVCPLTTGWMMLATWHYAHPFGPGGSWKNSGGDYETELCSSGKPPEKETQTGLISLHFDVTRWLINYPRARGVNYGLILLSDETVEVRGDAAGAHAPVLEFNRYPGR